MANNTGDKISDKKYKTTLRFGEGIATEKNLERFPDRFVNQSEIDRMVDGEAKKAAAKDDGDQGTPDGDPATEKPAVKKKKKMVEVEITKELAEVNPEWAEVAKVGDTIEVEEGSYNIPE